MTENHPPEEPKTTAQSMLGPGYTMSSGDGDGDPTSYRKIADPRYMEALTKQKAQRAKLTPRKRPVLRLVWNRDENQQSVKE